MSAETGAIILPAVLDLRAAASLKADLQAHIGSPLEIDASKVERLGASCLQVLLAFVSARPADTSASPFTAASEAFREDARLMGANTKLGLKAKSGSASC
jgi:chemotaxis protein CheX